MTREDLPDPVYNGWQVIDATPQEESDGSMHFSYPPKIEKCPVSAIKQAKKQKIQAEMPKFENPGSNSLV